MLLHNAYATINLRGGVNMGIAKDKVRTTVILKEDVKLILEELAKEEQRSFNSMVNYILVEYLKKNKLI